MPTLLRVGSIRFFFFSDERGEPPHVHARQGPCLAKFWLQPVELAYSVRFRPHELRRLQRIVEQNERRLLTAWNDYFFT